MYGRIVATIFPKQSYTTRKMVSVNFTLWMISIPLYVTYGNIGVKQENKFEMEVAPNKKW